MLLYPSMLAKALCIKNCLLFLLSFPFCYYSNFSKMLGAFPGKIPIFPTSRGMHSEPWQQAGDQRARCGRGGYSHGKAGLMADWGTRKSGVILPEDWIHPNLEDSAQYRWSGCSPRHQALLLRTLDLAWGSCRRRNERMRWEPQRISCSGQQTTASGRTVSPRCQK